MNHIVLMGRLTRDPEMRRTQSGVAVTRFTLAVDRPFSGRDGNERKADFINIVTWRNTAEFVSKYFVKGQMCAVAGRLQINDWTDKDGNRRTSPEVVADNVYFTESKKSRDGGYNSAAPANDYDSGYSAPVTGSDFAELDDEDGDLPF